MVAEGRGAGAFAADVYHMSAVCGHLVRLPDGRVNIGIKAAIGKRVRRDVQNAEYQRARR
jgi:hypothetical protein